MYREHRTTDDYTCRAHRHYQESHIITAKVKDVLGECEAEKAFVGGEDEDTTPKSVSVFGAMLPYH